MSGENLPDSTRELIALATIHGGLTGRLATGASFAFLVALFLGVGGGAVWQGGSHWCYAMWAGSGISLIATIVMVVFATRAFKRAKPISRALYERVNSGDPDVAEPPVEGEFFGDFEVLSSDESMIMLSRNRPMAAEIALRVGLLLLGIGITLALILTIQKHGFGFGGLIAKHPRAAVFYGSPLASLLLAFLAIQRRPSRWYASREESIIRIESVRWLFIRAVEDVEPSDVEAVLIRKGDLSVRTFSGTVHALQPVNIPNLPGLALGKTETESALRAVREVQAWRILGGLKCVFFDNPNWKLH